MTSPLVAVVDDDASVRRALTRLLHSAGLRVLACASAAEFLESGLSSAPDCVVLDIHLGGMSGLELLSRLRASGNEVPVLIITAHDDPRSREESSRLGCAVYVRKPFEASVMLEAVCRTLNREVQ